MHVKIYGGTDRGLQREQNEDAIRHAQFDNESVSLAIVADGVGGHAGGEIASQLAVDAVDDYVTVSVKQALNGGGYSKHWLHQTLANAIEKANRELINLQQQDTALNNMATTIVSVLIKDGRLALGYLGDSRCYRWRESELLQMTRDQTLAQQMLDQGVISHNQFLESPYHHVLSHALGLNEATLADISLQEIEDGDLYLLCSDGLTNCLNDQLIADILARQTDISQATEELITCANDAGGVDNISVVLVKCDQQIRNDEAGEQASVD